MAAGTGLVPGQGTKIPHAAWHSQKKKKKKIEKKPYFETILLSHISCKKKQYMNLKDMLVNKISHTQKKKHCVLPLIYRI